MSDTMLKLVDGPCPTVAADVFTATAKTSVLSIDISNPTGSPQSATLKLNGSILFSASMPSKGGISWHGPQILESAQAINLVADSASCNFNITGVTIT